MTDTSQFQTIVWRTWLDEAHTKPVYEAHVLCESDGHSVIGQGSTPNRAEKDARVALASILETDDGKGWGPKPLKRGQRVVLILSRDGDLERVYGLAV